MEKQKQKIETSFKDLEDRLGHADGMAMTDRKQEINNLRKTVQELDSEVQRFQRNAFIKYPDECEEFEQRCSDLSRRINTLAGDGLVIDQQDAPGIMDAENDGLGVTQQQIQQTNDKLKEGKSRALAMLQTVNNMKEEINQIDDEVMFQREKLLGVSERLKETQNMLRQTKRLVGFFSKAVYEDIIVKVLIGLISIAVLVILVMAIRIKFRKGSIEAEKLKEDLVLTKTANYHDIDEEEFSKLARHFNYDSIGRSSVKPDKDRKIEPGNPINAR